MRKVVLVLAVLAFSFSLVAGDINRDVTMFGSIFSTAINASGKARFKVSPFIVEDYGVFYFVHSPMMEIARRIARSKAMRSSRRSLSREERVKMMRSMRKLSKEKIIEGIQKAIIASAEYGDVLKSVPDKYWLVFVFQSPRCIGSVSLPGLVIRVKVKDVKRYAAGKMPEEEFARRIIIPPLPEKSASASSTPGK